MIFAGYHVVTRTRMPNDWRAFVMGVVDGAIIAVPVAIHTGMIG